MKFTSRTHLCRWVRLLKKWLHAGVLEDGNLTRSELGTVHGGSISPLLANTYLHYAFNLWVAQWRARHRPIAEQGQTLRAVVAGLARYFAVPCNGARVQAFRLQVGRLWHRTLCRRSQTKHRSWKRMHKIVAHWLPPVRICRPFASAARSHLPPVRICRPFASATRSRASV